MIQNRLTSSCFVLKHGDSMRIILSRWVLGGAAKVSRPTCEEN
ncbi:hypothetical protein RSSM_04023 [Rhodopirellula sallentina SM41]|uniref:Uncharacterized protein n=1 Tax=Rhodopirellula sallentina SM41 TaxID=1263870 RepID=M5TZB4_9BACT|nr:hypothetical protein RSSM_04023 [Rhodopirellula sallentina SM41]